MHNTIISRFNEIPNDISKEKKRDLICELYSEFGVRTVTECIVREAESCPVCQHNISGTDLRNIHYDPTTEEALIPYAVCPNNCIDILRHFTNNRWSPTTGDWYVYNLQKRARHEVLGLMKEHVEDVKESHLNSPAAEAGLSNQEYHQLDQHLTEIITIVNGHKSEGNSDT